MKEVLTGLVIAITGDFGGPRTRENVSRWINANGGTVCADGVTQGVTHLICTAEDYKGRAPKVRQALKLRTVKIVTFDWLEDGLLAKRRKPEKPYLLATLEKARRKRAREEQKAAQAATQRFAAGCRTAEEDLLSSNYHVYRDETLFEHSITLFRADPTANRNERHQLKLFESHALPHLYAASTRYTSARPRARTLTAITVLAPHGSLFDAAFRAFRAFFARKVGYAWETRLDARREGDGGEREGSEGGGNGEGWFKYCPPAAKMPRGRMVDGWAEGKSSHDKEKGEGSGSGDGDEEAEDERGRARDVDIYVR
ncbi:MAG: hypothetical protein M1832_005628 [Thelocarpon impressellum]|nr:MAG: hypothetical protein M1832_005628 [Thelocarpon impressellum]